MIINFDLQQKYNKIFIIGSGISLDFYDFQKKIDDQSLVIAINQSIVLYPQAHYLILCDWCALRNDILEKISSKKSTE